ncbi:cupredoxin domain-containing protein [Paenibacillus crassostreae]|uniref:Cytochrome C oxidase subunit II n=1 Tax=Paenibacillus crassostreae TaxID=1763538 RepID=A0A167GTN8_9BACL|nr:cupredoxin domain-containing protein [Paenibacillus crassostreae]AOZ92086.1 cytochrome C oxidase subunit II [Paenibacillus crassostreae]OAB77895.1 cytochrome C oxidase subunit II [Paenibacillus crassostreae]
MRKALVFIMSCVLLIALTACGGGKETSTNSSNDAVTDTGIAPAEEIVIKAVNYNFDQQEYHIKKGVPVKIVFENEEGNHGVMIPGLNLQLSTKKASAVITPNETGEYEIICSVFCGTGHGGMVSKLIVE